MIGVTAFSPVLDLSSGRMWLICMHDLRCSMPASGAPPAFFFLYR